VANLEFGSLKKGVSAGFDYFTKHTRIALQNHSPHNHEVKDVRRLRKIKPQIVAVPFILPTLLHAATQSDSHKKRVGCRKVGRDF
jgi:hypothetical protein